MARILVVDDEQLIADTLQMILTKYGFEVLAAYSAEQALAWVMRFVPDLLIADITMPGGKDGVELIDEMSRLLPNCQVLVLTGYYMNLNRVVQQSLALARPTNILTKPCAPGELLRETVAMLADPRIVAGGCGPGDQIDCPEPEKAWETQRMPDATISKKRSSSRSRQLQA